MPLFILRYQLVMNRIEEMRFATRALNLFPISHHIIACISGMYLTLNTGQKIHRLNVIKISGFLSVIIN